jgi:exonuclease VII large subunit
VDFTIADFVADMRETTPSAATEMVLREISVMSVQLKELRYSLNAVMDLIFNNYVERFERLKSVNHKLNILSLIIFCCFRKRLFNLF